MFYFIFFIAYKYLKEHKENLKEKLYEIKAFWLLEKAVRFIKKLFAFSGKVFPSRKTVFPFLWNFPFGENLDVASIIELQISIKIVFYVASPSASSR